MPWLRSLSIHLGFIEDTQDSVRRDRRFNSVRHLAELFDHYALHRPEMLRTWASGQDTDGAKESLPTDVVWQAELWRRLRERMGQPDPAERIEAACVRLRDEPALSQLGPRLSVFCLTRLPAAHLQVLQALAVARDIHLFLLHPSAVLWERIGTATERKAPIVRRSRDVTAQLPANRLLASWGQDAREMQLVLARIDDSTDQNHPVEDAGETLLERIQADVRADRSPPGLPLLGQPDPRPVRPGSPESEACERSTAAYLARLAQRPARQRALKRTTSA